MGFLKHLILKVQSMCAVMFLAPKTRIYIQKVRVTRVIRSHNEINQ